MNDLLRAEALKLTTTRLLWILIPAAVALSTAATLGAVLSAKGAGVDLETAAGVNRALHVTGTGATLVLALGAIITAGEFRTQTATDTFLTTPRRERVLAAKITISALIGAIIGALGAAISFGAAYLAYRIENASFPTTEPEAWATLAGAVAYAALFGVLGATVGYLTRNQIAAIVAALAWVLVVENIIISFDEDIARWLPGAAGQAIVRTPDRDLLPIPAAVAVLVGYAAVFAIGGLLVAARRDA
jgi:ABC-2 type transport system permease protein